MPLPNLTSSRVIPNSLWTVLPIAGEKVEAGHGDVGVRYRNSAEIGGSVGDRSKKYESPNRAKGSGRIISRLGGSRAFSKEFRLLRSRVLMGQGEVLAVIDSKSLRCLRRLRTRPNFGAGAIAQNSGGPRH